MTMDYYKNKADKFKDKLIEIIDLKGQENQQNKKVIRQQLKVPYNQLMENDMSSSIAFMLLNKEDPKVAANFRSHWAQNREKNIPLDEVNSFDIIPEINDYYIASLPKHSFAIQYKFRLATPYLSKDDNDLYIIESPVKKDRVFKVPMVSPSTWKGQLRWTVRKIRGYTDNFVNDNPQIIRLFGNERETEDSKCGRLVFYPTFFDKIGVEVINPHDRKTKAGTNPIYIEVVPSNANGTFTLLYIPFGRTDCDKNTIVNDMNVVVDGVNKMMLTYGFSAKKTNGYGLIQQNDLQGKLIFNELIEDEINEKEKIQEVLGNLKFPNNLTKEDLDLSGNFRYYDKNERVGWSSNKNRKYQDKKRLWEEYINNKKGLENRLKELKNTLPKIFTEPFTNLEELENKLSKLRNING